MNHAEVQYIIDNIEKIDVNFHDDDLENPDFSECGTAQLMSDIAYMLHGEFTDVVLYNDNFETKAHKSILAARSPVFRKMFLQSPALYSDKVHVPFTQDVVDGMLQFLYTASVISLDDIADDLLKIAEKYQIRQLKNLAENSLLIQMNVRNAADRLVLAVTCNAFVLKYKAKAFIIRNKAEVIKTPGFTKMASENPDLVLELLIAS